MRRLAIRAVTLYFDVYEKDPAIAVMTRPSRGVPTAPPVGLPLQRPILSMPPDQLNGSARRRILSAHGALQFARYPRLAPEARDENTLEQP
jgi:hypothetical protein